MNIYISNLSLNVIDSDLRRLFLAFGEVESAEIIRDKLNGRPKGTALVSMPVHAQGLKAVESLNQTELSGKKIIVTEAKSYFHP